MQLSRITALAIVASSLIQAENYVAVEYLQYDESDNRVSVMAPSITASYDIGTDYNIKADFVHDSVSGATPSYRADSASGASAKSTANDYVYGLQSFDEARNAGSVVITKRFENRDELYIGGDYSRESDFDAKTVSLEYMHYLNSSHNTSLSLGASYGYNEILSSESTESSSRIRRDDDRYEEEEDEHDTASGASQKEDSTSINIQAGVTQILSPTSSMKVAGFAIMDDGYLTNPHSLVVRDYGTAPKLVTENRPDSRRAYGVDLKYITLIGEDMSYKVGYRYYTDDWEIDSHTIENDLYYKLNKRFTLGAGLRYYTQSEASFYNGAKDFFTDEAFASSDERLSSFNALTYKASLDFKQDEEISYNVGAEFYSQSTGLDASMVTVGAKFKF